ncbi:adenosylcobinamide-GDP ribazoletransferase [Rahnella sp. PD12R]|uniref:adenosylcobinamide-GDP ribazoletransferase n=1 Tax=Rahnella sp. PD12R TaxID=2855688 RepID=UPI001C440A52|nr:adenosylcobinamide-GDP ribazoletransferase [Rahnella sp. PD12R]MBV6817352.1 adenosylcobinamide-GDP ribazoletransferase [Rahnella sp. PD12R]
MMTWRLFLATLQFLTRIPVKERWCDGVEMKDYPRGIVCFPFVGLVVGLLSALVWGILVPHVGAFPAAVAAVIAHIMLTGALHLDGLADTCDGLFSVRSRERILEIMRDSRIGTNGALALIVAILLRATLIYQLSADGLAVFAVLVVTPVIGRGMMSVMMFRQSYARESGMGNLFIGKISEGRFYATLLLMAALVLFIAGFSTLFALLVTLCFTFAFRRFVASRIGGQTGDTLGAACELSELVFLFLLLWH